ncbi:AAA family ATPase [Roseateles sp. MS654]|uniref:AAA family ATPase n=1 Tax=Roseateles sp. MS654 TaxID=3412685 RepID=UPI003C2FA291
MPELDWISVKGFKSIASIEKLKLGAINVVIGANGSGKSNFIGVFSFLHELKAGRLQAYTIKAGGANRVLHFGTKATQLLSVHVSFADERNQYSVSLNPTSTDELAPVNETVYFWDKSRGFDRPYSEPVPRVGHEAGISSEKCSQIGAYVREHFDRWRVYHFHDTGSSSPMKQTADLNDNAYLRPDGSNLASFLYFLKEKHLDAYELIRKSVKRVAPFFDDFQLEPQKLNPNKIRLEWRHVGTEDYFDTSSLSDGTLRFIALATLFLQPVSYRPSVILVDEPELGLHPFAVTMLASLVKQSAIATQVILSTQSPLLLDHFDPADVLVADRVEGGTRLHRLDVDQLDAWLEEYSLGQLWEKNELGGRPAAEHG